MLPTNQAGEIITAENVFHGLITRLVKLKDGLRKSNEIEIDFKEIIDVIMEFIYGYSPELVLPLIAHSEELIRTISESKDDFYRNIDDEWAWGYTDRNDKGLPDIVKKEIVYYSDFITKLREHFEKLEQLGLNNTNAEKIVVNISVPKLSWLVHFLTNDFGNTNAGESSKVLEADQPGTSRQFIRIFKKSDGKDIGFFSLRDKKSEQISVCSSLIYWRDVFKKYHLKCAELILEKECP